MNRKKCVAIWIGILSSVFVLAAYGQVEENEIPQGAGGTALLYGGQPDPEEMALQKGGLSGLGFTFINGDPFVRFQLQPDIDLGKIGFGLDVVLLYNLSMSLNFSQKMASRGTISVPSCEPCAICAMDILVNHFISVLVS